MRWRAAARLAALLAFALAFGACGGGGSSPVPAAGGDGSSARPNLVLILTDDLDARLGSWRFMPRLQQLLVSQGTSFSNMLVNVSLCCPSRASILRGQYAHNHEVFTNLPPTGGFETFLAKGYEASTVGTWLQQAGYRTALIGKYLNGYPELAEPLHRPAGWSEWISPSGGDPYTSYDYTLNQNGTEHSYGSAASDYITDVLSAKAVEFVRSSGSLPFFLLLASYAPHSPALPAPRHLGSFAGDSAPRSPNYDEEDVSDKPQWVQSLARLGVKKQNEMDELWRKRLESLQAVDEMIGSVVQAVEASGQLANTWFFFTSDNGFHLGQHRQVRGKQSPYEEDLLVPLVVRGPGVPAGRTLDQLVGNVDLAPTFAELAGATAPAFVDGRSLLPLLGASPPASSSWRQSFVIQHRDQGEPEDARTARGVLEPPDEPGVEVSSSAASTALAPDLPAFTGLRTRDYKYVEYESGERELYDLRADPWELSNLAGDSGTRALESRLAAILDQLRTCAGAGCRSADRAQP